MLKGCRFDVVRVKAGMVKLKSRARTTPACTATDPVHLPSANLGLT
jgi:hypothetical protein